MLRARVDDRFPGEGPQLWATATAGAMLEGLPGIDHPLEGLAVTYRDEPNYYGRIIVPGAFKDSLKKRPTRQKPLVMGYEHGTLSGTNPIGGWKSARDDPDQGVLLDQGFISDTAQGRDVATLVRDQALNGLSIGFITKATKFGSAGEEHEFVTPYGKRVYQLPDESEPVVFITQGELLETSIVSTPADDDARLHRHAFTAEASKALPGLDLEADWDDVAYSMALLQGGRGAGQAAFKDLPQLERYALYQRLAAGYERHGKTAPPYDPEPEFRTVPFAHDEREVFQQRFTAKRLADGAAGLEGLPPGPLSREGCAMLMRVARAALPHLEGPLPPEAEELIRAYQSKLDVLGAHSQLHDLAQGLREAIDLLKGGEK